MSNIIVCYLFTKFDTSNSIDQFIKHYTEFNAGLNHRLLICYKMLDSESIKFCESKLKNIPHTKYVDTTEKNDFDFGSYFRVCKNYPNNKFFFLNAKSYPIVNNWLKIINNHYKYNSLVGTTASYESALTSLKFKKFYKIFSFLLRFIRFKNNFNKFPNPHIRTTGFLINAIDYIEFYKDKVCNNKFDAWKLESGKFSITAHFKSKDYPVIIVNLDNASFNLKFWKISQTYNFLNQDKTIISDSHCRKYLNLNTNERLISQSKTWGE